MYPDYINKLAKIFCVFCYSHSPGWYFSVSNFTTPMISSLEESQTVLSPAKYRG